MKATRKENFRVIIEPRRLGDMGWVVTRDDFGGLSKKDVEREYESRCNEIIEQVKRHVDNVGDVYVDFEASEVCSHCGRDWDVSTDDSDPDWPKGMPFCCDKAIEEFEKQEESE